MDASLVRKAELRRNIRGSLEDVLYKDRARAMSTLKNPQRHDDLLNYQAKRLFALGGAPAVRLCEGGYGVARAEWRVVAALVEHGPMPAGELSERSSMAPERVSRVLKELLHKELVERTGDQQDRRRAVFRTTEAGTALYGELMPRLAAINRRLMEVLDDREAVLLEDFLARLTARARAILDEGGGVDVKAQRYLGTGRRVARLAPSSPPAWRSPWPDSP
jgi:DNA-binding MarR family transcriptional regulator